MKLYLAILCLIFVAVSCRQPIIYDNVKIKDGLYIDSSNGEILNGKYQSITPPENAMERKHVSTFEYSNGIPINDWTYSYGGEMIHTGKYLKEDNIKSIFQELTKSRRVDLDLWKEGDFPFLTVELIQPKMTDTLTLEKVVEISKAKLVKTYDFKQILIRSISTTDNNYIYKSELK